MDVALEPSALLVLRGDEPALRRLQFVEPLSQRLGQADVAQHQPGLRREIGDQLLLAGSIGSFAGIVDREGAELLALVHDGHASCDRPSPLAAQSTGQVAATRRASGADRATRALARRRAPSASTRAIRTQHIVGGVGARELVPELGQHLVRRGALAVHHTVGRASRPAPDRRKRQRNAERSDGGGDRTQRPHVGHNPDDGDDREVSEGDEPGHQADQHGLADHEIDVEQPVTEHGERDRDREQTEHDDRHVLQEEDPRRRPVRRQQRDDQDEGVEGRDDRRGGDEPLDLRSLDAARAVGAG